MKREVSLDDQVFRAMYPNKIQSSADPANWHSFVRHFLVKEIRHEIQHFLGTSPRSDSESFPGFDYTSPRIRARFARYKHHQMLFKALDECDLTVSEIHQLCNWEGTLAAKRKYEKDRGIVIVDIVDTEIKRWDDPAELNRRHAIALARQRGAEAMAQLNADRPIAAAVADGKGHGANDIEMKGDDDTTPERATIDGPLHLFPSAGSPNTHPSITPYTTRTAPQHASAAPSLSTLSRSIHSLNGLFADTTSPPPPRYLPDYPVGNRHPLPGMQNSTAALAAETQAVRRDHAATAAELASMLEQFLKDAEDDGTMGGRPELRSMLARLRR